MMHGKTSTRVNIRNAASEDAKVLNTVDEGTTFDIVEVQDNGWTSFANLQSMATTTREHTSIIRINTMASC